MDLGASIGKSIFVFARARACAFEIKRFWIVFSNIFLVSSVILQAAPSDSKTASELKGPHLQKKFAAIETLSKTRSRSSSQTLADALTTEKNPHVKLAILDKLASMRQPSVISSVSLLLRDSNTSVRQRAAITLGMIGGPAAARSLEASLSDSVVEVRQSAVRGLGLCGDELSLEKLKGMSTDANSDVRLNVTEAVNSMERKRGAPR